MGWTPDQVRACSIWDFRAAFAGWRAANCPDDDEAPLDAAEADDLASMLDRFSTLH